MNKEFSYLQMLLKGVKFFIVFGLAIMITQGTSQYPEILELTVGGILVMTLNMLKVKWNIDVRSLTSRLKANSQ